MSNQLNQALASAAASSAMEGMPLSDKDFVKQILEGSLTLAEYLTTIQRKHQEA